MTDVRPSIDEIKVRALAIMPALAAELAPDKGRIDGHRYWACNPTRSDSSAGSFCIDISGPTAGRWIEWAAGATAKEGEGGDVIDLVAYVLKGGSNFKTREARAAAIAWLSNRLGLQSGVKVYRQARKSAEELERQRREQAFAQQKAEKERNDRARQAAGWWLKAGKPCPGTPTELYLTKERGVPMHALPKWPGAIRHLEAYVHGGTGEVMPPAMFCAMTATNAEGAGEIRAVHRTFLTDDGRKDPDADAPRKMWGDPVGAAIRLSKGGSRLSPEEAVKQGELKPLVIGEAAEKALPACLLWPEARVWAAGTVGNMLAIARRYGWPGCASEILLVRDNDPETIEDKRTGEARPHPAHVAFEKAVQAWMDISRGRPVTVVEPIGAKDLDELWRSCADAQTKTMGAGAAA